jgi:hypothetical protein
MAVRHIILVLRIQVLVIYEDPTNLYWDENIIVEELQYSFAH